MFDKVIIGIDVQRGAEGPVALARALAPEADVVLACAYPFDETPSRFSDQGYGTILREDTILALREIADGLHLAGAGVEALPDPSPARALHRLAEREHADLIVTGSAHHGRVGRMVLGDVSRGVLHGAPCPVAVAPRDYDGGSPSVIGVAFDESAEAVAALRLATELAVAHRAALHVLQVVEPTSAAAALGGVSFDVGDLDGELREAAQRRLEERLADTGTQADARVVLGLAHQELTTFAAQVDVMVSGSRNWGPLRRVVLGSTSDRLIHNAPCPVIVMARSAVAPELAPCERSGTPAEA